MQPHSTEEWRSPTMSMGRGGRRAEDRSLRTKTNRHKTEVGRSRAETRITARRAGAISRDQSEKCHLRPLEAVGDKQQRGSKRRQRDHRKRRARSPELRLG